MDFTHNLKINQVTQATLVIGMDIAKRTHYASLTDVRGRVLQKKHFLYPSRERASKDSINASWRP
ncbi:hypothetical protein GCM10020331_058850 [Ectobacillus funiculus]